MKDEKKIYKTPMISQVNLEPEQAVLGGCKTASGDDMGGGKTCNHPSIKCPDSIGS
jgi:hypothetical protein